MASLSVSTLDKRFSYGNVGMCSRRPCLVQNRYVLILLVCNDMAKLTILECTYLESIVDRLHSLAFSHVGRVPLVHLVVPILPLTSAGFVRFFGGAFIFGGLSRGVFTYG